MIAPDNSVLDRLHAIRALVVGDVILDRYLIGKVDRISPEAPIPVVLKSGERSVLGGAANVARQIAHYGASAIIVGFVGEDAWGRELIRLSGASGVTTSFVTDPGRPTSVKTRVIAQNQQVVRIDAEEAAMASDALKAELIGRIEAALADVDVVILSDYAKGVLQDDMAAHIIALCRGAGLPVLVDPKSRDFNLYRGATAVSPNAKEMAEATDIPVTDRASAEKACAEALALFDIDGVILTRGEHGMAVARRGASVDHIPAHPPRKLFDVSGAGDTAIATTAAGLAAGLDLTDAARLANIAAGIAVGKFGTATVSLEELRHAMRLDSAHGAMDWEMAGDLVGQWQADGETVGFTNGVFDLLHEGHLQSLEDAASRCDRLVVAINSDSSTKALKGPDRPVVAEGARARLLSALRLVDAVVIFDEPTPIDVITRLQPDLLFKGQDYAGKTVVGQEVVEARGGRVELLPLVDGVSTTGIVERLARRDG